MNTHEMIPYEIYLKGYCQSDDVHSHGGIGGYAYVIVRDSEVVGFQAKSMPKYTDEFCMELHALTDALEYIKEIRVFREEVVVYCQQQLILKCYLEEWWKKWMARGWRNSNGDPIAHQNLWWRIIPYFQSVFYKVAPLPYTYRNPFYQKCLRIAKAAALEAKEKYYQEKRENYYNGTATNLE